MTLRREIDDYYAKRGLEEPDQLESLLWLLSEVGELAEAYLANHPALSAGANSVVDSLRASVDAGVQAESCVVSMRETWVRNGERMVTKSDVASEIADCCMMLDRFAKANSMDAPSELLRRKMERKLR